MLEYMRNLLFRNGHIVVQSSVIPVMGFACNPVKYECINTSRLHEMRDLLLFSGPGLILDDLQPQPLSLSPPVDVVHLVQNTDFRHGFGIDMKFKYSAFDDKNSSYYAFSCFLHVSDL